MQRPFWYGRGKGRQFSTQWGYFAACAIVVSVPVMGLFFALQKHLVGGLTAGSVKG